MFVRAARALIGVLRELPVYPRNCLCKKSVKTPNQSLIFSPNDLVCLFDGLRRPTVQGNRLQRAELIPVMVTLLFSRLSILNVTFCYCAFPTNRSEDAPRLQREQADGPKSRRRIAVMSLRSTLGEDHRRPYL